ncbi:hypothetical protein QJS66_10470 [Kocuria rhizophila]|nr:hypothetical protein QJS66_10470 [Kocuria rhizophila]
MVLLVIGWLIFHGLDRGVRAAVLATRCSRDHPGPAGAHHVGVVAMVVLSLRVGHHHRGPRALAPSVAGPWGGGAGCCRPWARMGILAAWASRCG